MKNKRVLLFALFMGALFLTSGSSWGQDGKAAPDVDGVVWMQSSSQEKRAFLFGAGSAIVLEYYLRTKHGEQPSRFVQGWVAAFKDQTWAEMEKTLDAYYTANPDKRDEHVFHVIWKQMINPKVNPGGTSSEK